MRDYTYLCNPPHSLSSHQERSLRHWTSGRYANLPTYLPRQIFNKLRVRPIVNCSLIFPTQAHHQLQLAHPLQCHSSMHPECCRHPAQAFPTPPHVLTHSAYQSLDPATVPMRYIMSCLDLLCPILLNPILPHPPQTLHPHYPLNHPLRATSSTSLTASVGK